jgi:hypothetical protein
MEELVNLIKELHLAAMVKYVVPGGPSVNEYFNSTIFLAADGSAQVFQNGEGR